MKKTLLLVALFIFSIVEAQTISTVFSNQTTNTSGIAINGNTLYAGGFFDGIIYKVDLSQPNPTASTYVSVPEDIYDLCIKGNYLYASVSAISADSGRIIRIDITQPNPTVENVISLPFPNGITIDNEYLYVNSDKKLLRIDLNAPNATPVVVVDNLNVDRILGTNGLLVIGNYIFVSTPNKLVKYNLGQTNPQETLVVSGFTTLQGITKGETDTIIYGTEYNPDHVVKINTADGTFSQIATTPSRTNWDIIFTGNGFYVSNLEGGDVIKIDMSLSVDDFHKDKIKIYPVPSANIVNFEKGMFLGLTEMDGKHIDVKNNNGNSIDISDLPKGTYIVKLNVEGKIFHKKIVKK
ncbi:hypothetical protein ABH942_002957 [Flavobacterium sp. 28YEA47A]|uniref:T9SS type A sorting domain-containing protein n=1 Tax=Flavobacterium sp. 28YEA47A TaxID=3156276 RepID=UPI0035190A77